MAIQGTADYSVSSDPQENLQTSTLGRYFWAYNQMKVIWNSLHGFTNSESCLTNLIVFCEKTTSFMGEGRTISTVSLDFREPF